MRWTDSGRVPADALADRVEAWLARAEGVVDDDAWAASAEVLRLPWPADLKRVPCHRDLHWWNILVQRTPAGLSCAVIDFGQARLDVRFADLEVHPPDPCVGRRPLVSCGVRLIDGHP